MGVARVTALAVSMLLFSLATAQAEGPADVGRFEGQNLVYPETLPPEPVEPQDRTEQNEDREDHTKRPPPHVRSGRRPRVNGMFCRTTHRNDSRETRPGSKPAGTSDTARRRIEDGSPACQTQRVAPTNANPAALRCE